MDTSVDRKNVFELMEDDSNPNSSEGKVSDVKQAETVSLSSSDIHEDIPPPEQNADDVREGQITTIDITKSPTPKKTKDGSAKKAKPRRKRRVKHHDYDGSDSGDDALDPRAKQLFKKYAKQTTRGQKGSGGETLAGPFIRATGLGNGDQARYTLVNSSTSDAANGQVIGKTGVLEPHFYDLANCDPDLPWLCCFCRRPPCYGQLSYLYGPYNISSSKCRDYLMSDPHDCYSHEKPYRKNKTEDSGPLTVWFHWECFLFTNGCYFINKLIGLDDAVKIAVKSKCSHCKQPGATLSCCMKNCSKMYHYLCGRDAGASFNEEYCTIFCQNHKQKKGSND